MAGNNIQAFPLAGKPSGMSPGGTYAVNDKKHNQDHEALSDFPFSRNVRGANCHDKASDVVHCEIFLEPIGGVRDVADAGCPVKIYYNGTHIWKTTVLLTALGETYCSFSDANCESHAGDGVGIPNYGDPAFIAALHAEIKAYPSGNPKLVASEILLDGAAPGGVHGGKIPRSAGAPAAGSIDEGLSDLEGAVGQSIDLETGKIKAEAIDSTMFALSADVYDSDDNLVTGYLDQDDDGDGIANGYYAYGAGGVYALTPLIHEKGSKSQEVVASGPGQGIAATYVRPHSQTDHRGSHWALHVRLQVTVADSVLIEVWDGVSSVILTAPGPATPDAFQSLILGGQFAADKTALEVRIYSTKATAFYVDGVKLSLGKKAKAISPTTAQTVYDMSKVTDKENWILNSDFRDWTNPKVGARRYPDWWEGGANPPTACDRDDEHFYFGGFGSMTSYGFNINLAAGQSVRTKAFDIPLMIPGESGWLTFMVYGIAGTDPIRIQSNIGSTVLDAVPDIGSWRRLMMFVTATANTYSLLTTVSLPAGSNNFVISGPMFNRGVIPAAWEPSALVIPFTRVFVIPGAISAGLMYHQGARIDQFPVSRPTFVHKLVVRNGTPPGTPGSGITDTYTVLKNGADPGGGNQIRVSMFETAQDGAVHNLNGISYAPGDRYQVIVAPDAMGSGAADVTATIEGIEMGI